MCLEDGWASTTSDWGAGGAVVTTVVLTADGVPAMTTLPGFPTATPGIVSGVVVVVVVVTERVGAGGGGADTTCDLGPETQPARSPMAPQQAKSGVNFLTTKPDS